MKFSYKSRKLLLENMNSRQGELLSSSLSIDEALLVAGSDEFALRTFHFTVHV